MASTYTREEYEKRAHDHEVCVQEMISFKSPRLNKEIERMKIIASALRIASRLDEIELRKVVERCEPDSNEVTRAIINHLRGE